MRKQITMSLALATCVVATANAGSLTEDFSRAGKSEIIGFGQYLACEDSVDLT